MESGVNYMAQHGHAVIICVKLSNDDLGEPAEREDFLDLEDACLDALEEQPELGEVDGIEEGDGYFRIVCFGPDADALFGALESTLRARELPGGSYAIKRFGVAEDVNTREEHVALSA